MTDSPKKPIDTDAFNRKAAFIVLGGIVIVPAIFGIVMGVLALLGKV